MGDGFQVDASGLVWVYGMGVHSGCFRCLEWMFEVDNSGNLRMYLWWSLCTLHLHACQVRVTVGDSSLCCCTCVTYFEH